MVKFATNASGAIWWPKNVTDASGATWWSNLEPMQVAFFLLAEEIIQAKEAIPWVRCASGNVFLTPSLTVSVFCMQILCDTLRVHHFLSKYF